MASKNFTERNQTPSWRNHLFSVRSLLVLLTFALIVAAAETELITSSFTHKSAHAASTCANFQPGKNNPGFNNIKTPYTVLGDFGQIGSQRLTVDLDGADDCDLQGSRYVRAKATLWDGSGNVEAFVDQQGSGAVLGTSVTKDPGDFYNSTYSNIYNAAGLTVRACGNFHTNGRNEIHCGAWVNVPA